VPSSSGSTSCGTAPSSMILPSQQPLDAPTLLQRPVLHRPCPPRPEQPHP
jgi:hypothetical protein